MIHEYQCKQNHITERDITFGERPPKYIKCERCALKAWKLLAKPDFIFKGAGFHCNDYKK